MTAAMFAERFWERVNKDGPIVRPELGPCWSWTGRPRANGYGACSRHGKMVYAHRVAFEFLFGRPPAPGLVVMHECDNPLCVRHLREGTQADNVADQKSKGRTTSGERCRLAKLTWGSVNEIRASRETVRALSARFGVTISVISEIRNGKRWVPYRAQVRA